jgi:acyl-CoA synthetase (AMP-forming)/AMP-acid ligase II
MRTLPRLRTIANDAGPMLALSTSSLLSKVESMLAEAPELRTLRWVATDTVDSSAAPEWHDPGAAADSLALLQYTSGSTATPRGVMVSHENLFRNSAHISRAFAIAPDTVSVTWLPVHHDMGLTNGIVQPIYGGRQCVLMSPQSFLQQPVRWLRAIARYGAKISGGPNFAYDMCARKITAEQREGLDLDSWEVAYNGAEPLRADTLIHRPLLGLA